MQKKRKKNCEKQFSFFLEKAYRVADRTKVLLFLQHFLYIDKENELIVGMQTNRPLKRGVNPFGGIRMARQACEAYGYHLSSKVEEEFRFRTTHNDGVFAAYTPEIRKARKAKKSRVGAILRLLTSIV